jgi:hypothetical protein
VTLTPVADVHIRQAAPTTTHGSVTRMNVDLTDTGAVGSEARAYLRFEVPPLATGETIQSARLSVQVTDATTDGPAIWKTATAWTEATMTWNSGRPARSGLAAVGNFVDMPLGRRSVPVSDRHGQRTGVRSSWRPTVTTSSSWGRARTPRRPTVRS